MKFKKIFLSITFSLLSLLVFSQNTIQAKNIHFNQFTNYEEKAIYIENNSLISAEKINYNSPSISIINNNMDLIFGNTKLGIDPWHFQRLKNEINNCYQWLETYHIAGQILLIDKYTNNHPILINYGYANYQNKIPNSINTSYPTGSLQKMITAAIMMKVIIKSQKTKSPINLDTKINRWYPNLTHADKVNIQDLMCHTSGYQDLTSESDHKIKYLQLYDPIAAIKRIKLYYINPVGTYNYNNDNYVLLAGIIEKETHYLYNYELYTKIIGPLNLKNTYPFNHVPTKYKSTSYLFQNDQMYQSPEQANTDVLSQLVGACSLYSNAYDYYKIINGLTNGQILNKKQFQEMTNHTNNKANYDGGFHSYKYNHGITRIHAGYFSGSHQYNKVELNQDNSEGIIVFFNELPDNNNANLLINNIINNYYQGELKPLMFETNKNNKTVNTVDKLDKNNKKEIIKNR